MQPSSDRLFCREFGGAGGSGLAPAVVRIVGVSPATVAGGVLLAKNAAPAPTAIAIAAIALHIARRGRFARIIREASIRLRRLAAMLC